MLRIVYVIELPNSLLLDNWLLKHGLGAHVPQVWGWLSERKCCPNHVLPLRSIDLVFGHDDAPLCA